MSSKVQIVITAVDKASKELKKITKEAEKSGKTTQQQFRKVGAALGAVTVAIAAAGMAMKKLWELAGRGTEVRRAEQALRGYAGSARDAAATLREVQDATDGAVSRTAAMGMASKLLAMNLASTSAEAGRLAEIAVTLGASMGKGPEQAFEQFTLLLANQSILRLDTFGISATEVRDRMATLVDEGMEPADRQGRFLTATLEAAERKMRALGEAGFDASSGTEQLTSAMQDLKDELALEAAEVIDPIAEGFALAIRYRRELTRFQEVGLISTSQVTDANMRLLFSLRELERVDQAWIERLQDQGQILDGVTGGVQSLAEAELEAAEALSIVGASLGDVTERMLFQKLAAGLDAEATRELARAMGLLNEESFAALTAADRLNAAFASGAITAGRFEGAAGALAAALGNVAGMNAVLAGSGAIGRISLGGGFTFGGPGGAIEGRGGGGGGGGTIPGMAEGGPVKGGKMVVVGEEGPELFVPKSPGMIFPGAKDVKPPSGGSIPKDDGATKAQTAALQAQIAAVPARVGSQIVAQQISDMRQSFAISDRRAQEQTTALEEMSRTLRDLPRRFAKEITSSITQVLG